MSETTVKWTIDGVPMTPQDPTPEPLNWSSWTRGRCASHMKYFTDFIEYPTAEKLLHGLERGVWHQYVSHTYLAGLINYVIYIKAVVLERYTQLRRPDGTTRLDAMPAEFHTKLSSFGDDVVLLCRMDRDTNEYWVFWFDCDVSDCGVGWFTTLDDPRDVYVELRRWILGLAVRNAESRGKEREDWESVSDFAEIDVSHIKGWVSW